MNVFAQPKWDQAPDALSISDSDQKKLYDLIWKRTIASQMSAARLERTTVEIGASDGQVGLRATGQVMLFDGFMRVYEEGQDDTVVDEDDKRLPQISAKIPWPKNQSPQSSITPSHHRATPRPAWLNVWKSWASAGPRPMRQSSPRSKIATMCAKRKIG